MHGKGTASLFLLCRADERWTKVAQVRRRRRWNTASSWTRCDCCRLWCASVQLVSTGATRSLATPITRLRHVVIHGRSNKVSCCRKLAHTRLPSVEFRGWFRFLAVSLQVTWVINPAVSCHYFPPGLQLPSQPLRGLLPISLLGEQRHDGCEQFA